MSANGQWRPLWSWGDGVDAEAPGPVPGSERIKKYREKMSADDKDFGLARRRQKRRVVKRDPLVAAFFWGLVILAHQWPRQIPFVQPSCAVTGPMARLS